MLNEKKVLMTGLILLILFSGIGIVSAETLSGTIGNSGLNSTSYGMSSNFVSHPGEYINTFSTSAIQNNGGLKSITLFHGVAPGYDAGAPPGSTTTFQARYGAIGGAIIGNGTLGYQRLFTPTEQPGYFWLELSDWNIGSYTGAATIYLVYNRTQVYNYSYTSKTADTPPAGTWTLGTASGAKVYGTYMVIKDISTTADYIAVKPSGIGISGNVTKTLGNSQVFIYNGLTGAAITSESALSPTKFNFSVVDSSIIIGIKSAAGITFNSSILFGPVTPTPTPYTTTTITPSPYDPFGPIPAGRIRSMCQNTDSETDGAVHYSNVSIRDVQNSSWSNITSRFDGTWYIDTLPNHTIDCYGAAPGYTSASRLGLPASSTNMYELFLHPGYVPPATDGKVRLYVLVNDYESGLPINGALVSISGSGQNTVSQTTGKSGDVVLEWVNLSTVYVTASKTGYTSGSRTGTTTAAGPDTIRIEIHKATITASPTTTIPPGGVTPAVTMDTRSSSEKDIAMMDMIRSAGPQLISIAIAATAFGLLGLIMKSMKF